MDIIAVVCGYFFLEETTVHEFLAISYRKEVSEKEAWEAAREAVRAREFMSYELRELFEGITVYFYSTDLTLLKEISFPLETEDVSRALVGQEGDYDDFAWLFGEPRPVTWGDLEPFAPEDWLEDIDWWP